MARSNLEELEHQLGVLVGAHQKAGSIEAASTVQREIDVLNSRWLRLVIERNQAGAPGSETVRLALLDIGARSHREAITEALRRAGSFDGPMDASKLSGRDLILLIGRWMDETDQLIIAANQSRLGAAAVDEMGGPGVDDAEFRRCVAAKYEVLECLRPIFETVRDLRIEPVDTITDPGEEIRRPRRVLKAAAAGAILLVLFAIVRSEGSGGDSAFTPTGSVVDDSAISDSVTSSLRAESITSDDFQSIPGAECVATAEGRDVGPESTTMTVSSPDLPGTIPEMFWRESGYELGFPTPAFDWSGIPIEATELALSITQVPTSELAKLSTDGIYSDGPPEVENRWTVVGIDPSSVGIERTSVGLGLPKGAVEVGDNGVFVKVGEEWTQSKFAGPSSAGETFIVSLFALCDPATGQTDEFDQSWLLRWSIDRAYFTAESAG